MTKNLAPIVLFVYNRLGHTVKTIESLKKNDMANQSHLFIFSDGPKDVSDTKMTDSVRSYIKNINGFKEVIILEQENNLGLAKSIINGVSQIINEYERIIVLEDDLITSPFFLKFMNESLIEYKDNKNVWGIGGYTYPINHTLKEDCFFAPYITSWGWATWKNRWHHFERNPTKLINNFDNQKIQSFNLDNTYKFWDQVSANAEGKIHTWAVFWYATVFLNKGLVLYPKKSLVQNIGHDGSGISGDDTDLYRVDLANKPLNVLLNNISLNNDILKEVKKYLKNNKSLHKRFLSKIRSFFS